MKCPNCETNDAIMHQFYGPMWCKACVEKYDSSHSALSRSLEDPLPYDMREQRKQYAKELLQPYRGGEFSQEYRDAYPKQAKEMVKAGVITQEQHDKARPVWKGDVPGV